MVSCPATLQVPDRGPEAMRVRSTVSSASPSIRMVVPGCPSTFVVGASASTSARVSSSDVVGVEHDAVITLAGVDPIRTASGEHFWHSLIDARQEKITLIGFVCGRRTFSDLLDNEKHGTEG